LLVQYDPRTAYLCTWLAHFCIFVVREKQEPVKLNFCYLFLFTTFWSEQFEESETMQKEAQTKDQLAE